MQKVTRNILAALLAAGTMVMVGCGGDEETDGGPNPDTGGGDMQMMMDGGGIPTGTPTLAITAPAAGSTVMGDSVDVTWMAGNWKGFPPMDPGCPNGSNNCGHVHLRIAPKASATMDADFMVCNDVAGGKPYNNAGGMPLKADFTKCTMMSATGDYTIEIEFRHNNHGPITPVTKSAVNIKRGGGGMGAPTLTLTAPTPAQAFPAGTTSIMTTWMATNWMGFPPMDPGCMNESNNCGHAHLRVAPKGAGAVDADFLTCNDAAAMKPYNNAGGMPLAADLTKCTAPSATGDYTIEVEFRHNNHGPLTPPVKSAVSFKVGP
jgi:hypothetical protein